MSGERPAEATREERGGRGGVGSHPDGANPAGGESAGSDESGDAGGPLENEAARQTDVEPAVGESVTVQKRRTRRWYGIGCLSLFALGVGIVTGFPATFLASVFGIAVAGYGAVTSAPDADLAVERAVETTEPEPGDEVRVTVTVRNEGSRPLVDLRIVDGVPHRLGVVDGSPRHGAVLMPGDETVFSYSVQAERGEHAFDRVTVLVRDVAGATERVVAVGERTTLRPTVEFPTEPPEIPLRKKVSQFTGRFPGDTGGPGIEFHATRQYRRGDPLSRVDWRRTARTGELTTVEYRVERTVRVALVFDARDVAHVAPEPHRRSAVERSVDGGIVAYASLTEAGHDVGIGAIGPSDCWLSPGSGDRHRTAAQHLFRTDPALSTLPSDGETNIYETSQRLKGRLSADSQVMLFTPLVDDRILDTAVRLDAHGFAVTVISPDPTHDETTGQVYDRLHRRLRIANLRSRAIPVIDWRPDETLDEAIARVTTRWSA